MKIHSNKQKEIQADEYKNKYYDLEERYHWLEEDKEELEKRISLQENVIQTLLAALQGKIKT